MNSAIGKATCLLIATSFFCAPARAQSVNASRSGIALSAATEPIDSPQHDGVQPPTSMLVSTLASAVIPGAGQALLGSRRAFAYATAELAAWITYSIHQGNGERQRDRYRELSRSIARASFNPAGPAGNWDYYERMEKFAASGPFDAIPGGAVDPPSDLTTYNGSMWLLARQTYWRDANQPPPITSPEYQAALAFYIKRAVPEDMLWSWVGSPDGLQQYKRAIATSNSQFRRAEQTVGVVIANHILSAVDAFVSVKLTARQSPDGRVALTAGIPIGFNY